MTLHFLHDPKRPKSIDLFNRMVSAYGQNSIEDADTIVAIGGDGSVLYALARAAGKTVFGLMPDDARSVGFWVNRVENPEATLADEVAQAKRIPVVPVRADVTYTDASRAPDVLRAFNEVSIVRDAAQATFLDISGFDGGDGAYRFAGDGVYLSTPLGSTGTNRSYHGPILAPGAQVAVFGGMGIYQPREFVPVITGEDARITVTPVTSAGKRPIRLEFDGNTMRPDTDIASVTLQCDTQKRAYLALARRSPSPFQKIFG